MNDLSSHTPLLSKKSKIYNARDLAILFVSVSLATCIGIVHFHSVISLEGSATVPIPLDPRLVPVNSKRLTSWKEASEMQPIASFGERAVAALTSLILRSDFVKTGGKFQVFKGMKLSQQNPIIVVDGKQYLRTTLLDALSDYSTSLDAKTLVNEAIEEQAIDAANGGTIIPPETMAANAFERLQAGDLDFEDKWAVGGEMHIANSAVNISTWEAQTAVALRDDFAIEKDYQSALAALSSANAVLTQAQENYTESALAVQTAENALVPLEAAVKDATTSNNAAEAQVQNATAEVAAAEAAVKAAESALAAAQSDVNATGLEVADAYTANSDAAQALTTKQTALTDATEAAATAASALATAQAALNTGQAALASAQQVEASAAAGVSAEQGVVTSLTAVANSKQQAAAAAEARIATSDAVRTRAGTAAQTAATNLGWSAAMGVPPSLEPDGTVPPRTWVQMWS